VSRKRNNHHEEEHPDESWLLPYSDLMTLLLALFIVLYAASSANISKFDELSRAFKTAFSSGLGVLDNSTILETNSAAKRTTENQTRKSSNGKTARENLQQQEQQNLELLKKQLDQYIKTNGLSSQLNTLLNQSELLITIRDNALFTSGSAKLKPDSEKLGAAIGHMLQSYPDYEILVTGHTDNEPINTAEFPSNWELSSKRAINFMKVLLANPAFDPRRFSATGYGEFRPLESNDTDAGRAKNRRVEVSILRKYIEPSADGQALTLTASAQ
jgi:chemotaxis protein MotB